MSITNEECRSEKYTIISYSHADESDVMARLELYKRNGVRFWFDERMNTGDRYDEKFFEILDCENCKGIVFFISNNFFLSKPCFEEMRYFKEKYANNPDKFCIFVLPQGYPNEKSIYIHDRLSKHLENDPEKLTKLELAEERVQLFLELNHKGKSIHATLNNDLLELEKFDKTGITGYGELIEEKFGYFPQIKDKFQKTDIKKDPVMRDLDKEPAYYAPVDWFVIKDGEQSQTLLSKDLLFVIDYLNLKYPFKSTGKTIASHIEEKFKKYFYHPDHEDLRNIKEVRFITAKELKKLLRCSQKNIDKKREILLPRPTYFAQISNHKPTFAFWLAGDDTEDARWVDPGTETLSERSPGTELYYVRVVIEVAKQPAVAV